MHVLNDEKNESSLSLISDESKESDTNIIKGKKVVGIGLGNIFEGGQIKLRPAGGGPAKKPPATTADKVLETTC